MNTRTCYFYQKNEIVFAETQGHKPYPARVTSFDRRTGVYRVSFIGYKSSSFVTADMMEKFDNENIARYEELYRNSTNKDEKTIFAKIALAKRELEKSIQKKTKKIMTPPKNKSQQKNEKQVVVVPEEHKVRIQEAEKVEIVAIVEQPKIEKMDIKENMDEKIEIKEVDQKPKIDSVDQPKSSKSRIQSLFQKLPIPLKKNPKPAKQRVNENNDLNMKSQQQKQEDNIQSKFLPVASKQSPASLKIQDNSSPIQLIKKVNANIQENVNVHQYSQTIKQQPINRQSISSVNSLRLQHQSTNAQTIKKQPIIPEVIREEIEQSSKNEPHYIKRQLFENNIILPPWKTEYGSQEYEDSECSIQGKQFGVEQVDMFDIDNEYDDLGILDGDYAKLRSTMNYRITRINMLIPEAIIRHLSKIIDAMVLVLERVMSGKNEKPLSMKKKGYLMAIMFKKDIDFIYFLGEDCIFKMIDFAIEYVQMPAKLQKLFQFEHIQIRSRLNILAVKFKAQKDQLSISKEKIQELTYAFDRFKNQKVIIR